MTMVFAQPAFAGSSVTELNFDEVALANGGIPKFLVLIALCAANTTCSNAAKGVGLAVLGAAGAAAGYLANRI